jgi:hypothetical protein
MPGGRLLLGTTSSRPNLASSRTWVLEAGLPPHHEVRQGQPKRFRFDQLLEEEGGFHLLAENPDREIVLGFVGRWWDRGYGRVDWSAEEFRDFDRPGFGVGAWNFRRGAGPFVRAMGRPVLRLIRAEAEQTRARPQLCAPVELTVEEWALGVRDVEALGWRDEPEPLAMEALGSTAGCGAWEPAHLVDPRVECGAELSRLCLLERSKLLGGCPDLDNAGVCIRREPLADGAGDLLGVAEHRLEHDQGSHVPSVPPLGPRTPEAKVPRVGKARCNEWAQDRSIGGRDRRLFL